MNPPVGKSGPCMTLRRRSDLGVVDDGYHRVYRLAHIVGRDVGGKPDRNAARSVDEKVGEPAGEHVRLLHAVVEVGTPRHGVLVKIPQKFERERTHPRLGVPHRGGGIAVRGTEVAVSVDELHTHGEGLRHPHHRAVDGTVTVGVVFAQAVTHYTRGFLVRLVGRQPHLVHGVKYASLHGFQTVLHARKGAVENDVLGVRQHAVVHDVLEYHVIHRRRILQMFLLLALSHCCPYPSLSSLTAKSSTRLKSAYL